VSRIVAKKIGAIYFSVDEILDENGLDKALEGEGIPLENFLRANEILMGNIDRSKPIVIDGNFYHKAQLENLISFLGEDVVVFTLKAPVELCVARDAAREKSYGEDAARVVHMFVSAFDYGTVIETAHQTAEDTAESILAYSV
jgi:hypothetical protein